MLIFDRIIQEITGGRFWDRVVLQMFTEWAVARGVGAAANSYKFPKYLPRGATLFDFVVVYSGIKKRISGRSLLSTIVLCYVCDAHNNAWCRGTEVRKH